MKIAITAAAPINPDLVKFFMAIGVPLFELYGLSETTGPATTNVPGAVKVGSVGKPLPGVEAKLAEDGIRYTDFYAASGVCSPSRAVLMTGQSPGRVHCRGNGDENRMSLWPWESGNKSQ